MMKPRISKDHITWGSNYAMMHDNLTRKIKKQKYSILPMDTIFRCVKLTNASIVLLRFGDVPCDRLNLVEMDKIAEQQNLKFTIITDVFYTEEFESSFIKILFVKEFYGVYYNDYVSSDLLTYDKLYNFLVQRTEENRTHQFYEFFKHNLIDLGKVSLLAYQIDSNVSPSDIVNDINKEAGYIYSDMIDRLTFPFANFDEPDTLFELESSTKYSIVFETYNDLHNLQWCVFTEKTMRSLQVANISILQNKTGSVKILEEMGFKVHPINHVLDQMTGCLLQAKFVIKLLEHDMFGFDNIIETAEHNQALLKSWYDELQTEEFYNNVVDQVL